MDFNGQQLAYIGDAYWSLIVRESIIKHNIKMGLDSNIANNRYCSAVYQSELFHQLESDNFFSEKELEIYKKGRNIKVHKPSTHNIAIYRCASGFEALIGYLYLENNVDRIKQIWDKVELENKE